MKQGILYCRVFSIIIITGADVLGEGLQYSEAGRRWWEWRGKRS
jgi:hypothetical protein